MLLTHTIKPSVDLSSGVISLDQLISEPGLEVELPGARQRFYTQVVRTRESATRAALIRLGWTPPVDSPPPEPSAPLDETRMRVRAYDPTSSVMAAERAHQFAGSHCQRILHAMRDDELSSHQIARQAGLTVVQVDRRLIEMQREGTIEVVICAGEELLRTGYRVWRRVRSSGS